MVLIVTAVIWALFHPSDGGTLLAKESVLGLEVGASLEDVGRRFSSRHEKEFHGNPWVYAAETAKHKHALGHVLKQEDLGDQSIGKQMKLLSWANEGVVVLFHDDAVRAIIIHQPYRAATGRGLRIGDSESRLKDLYPERPLLETLPLQTQSAKSPSKPPGYLETYRYDDLGIGFEIQDKRVRSITLFPSRAQRDGH